MPEEHLPRYEPSSSHEYKPLVVPPRDLPSGERETLYGWRPYAPTRLRVGAKIALCVLMVTSSTGMMAWRTQRAARYEALFQEASRPATFPFAELAALDRDVQARFAVVPEKDFGMGRIGKAHYLYVPQTEAEKQTIAALKRQRLEVVFYVVAANGREKKLNRSLFLPLQGPVHITRSLRAPLPRWSAYSSRSVMTPDGTPLPVPTPGSNLPTSEAWQSPDAQALFTLGRRVLTLAQAAPSNVNPAASVRLKKGRWRVVGVPVRATDHACVDCHNAQTRSYSRQKLQMHDAIGIAFYAYRRMEAQRQKQALQREGHEGANR